MNIHTIIYIMSGLTRKNKLKPINVPLLSQNPNNNLQMTLIPKLTPISISLKLLLLTRRRQWPLHNILRISNPKLPQLIILTQLNGYLAVQVAVSRTDGRVVDVAHVLPEEH